MTKASILILSLLVLTSSACSTRTAQKLEELTSSFIVSCLNDSTVESGADITEEGGWEATIHLAEISPYLNFWGESSLTGMPYSNRFILDDSDNAFLLLTLSLAPIGEDNTLCLHDLVITDNNSVSFYPIGIDPEGNEAHLLSGDRGFGTSGACDIVQASSNSVNINCDMRYDINNTLGITVGDTIITDVQSREYKWSNELPVSEATVFYVLPIETILSGGLKLKLSSSESIELPSCFYRPTVYVLSEIGDAVPWCQGDGSRVHLDFATFEAIKAEDPTWGE